MYLKVDGGHIEAVVGKALEVSLVHTEPATTEQQSPQHKQRKLVDAHT